MSFSCHLMKRKMISLIPALCLLPQNEPEHQSDALNQCPCLSKSGGCALGGESLGFWCLPLGVLGGLEPTSTGLCAEGLCGIYVSRCCLA